MIDESLMTQWFNW